MNSPAPDFATLRFSSEDLPPAERIPFWREVFGRTIVKLDIEPLPDTPFYSAAVLRALPGLGIFSAVSSGMRTQRSGDLLAHGGDDVILSVQMAGMAVASQLGQEVTIAKGHAVLISGADIGVLTYPKAARRVGVRLPRKVLAPLVVGLEDVFARPIPPNNEALRLLVSYLFNVMRDRHALATPELRRLVVAHVDDLVALTLGATRDAAAVAEGRGVRAARLRAIKTDIAEHLDSSDLSVAGVAARQRVTPRYVQMLFGNEGTTFSQFVLAQRLARAYRMLNTPRYAGWTIGAIAFEVGFTDLSYFNRSFRRLYAASPSDVRNENGPPARRVA